MRITGLEFLHAITVKLCGWMQGSAAEKRTAGRLVGHEVREAEAEYREPWRPLGRF